MNRCEHFMYLLITLLGITITLTLGAPAEAEIPLDIIAHNPQAVEGSDDADAIISEDIIPDVENTTHKVIRVNPLDIPALQEYPIGTMDSSLYKIQTLLQSHRSYVNSNRLRRPRPKNDATSGEPKMHKPLQQHRNSLQNHYYSPNDQKKQLHFLYNQPMLDGRVVGKTMRVHLAPGAYPVYYVLAKTNGRFGKHPIKGFRDESDFMKYLLKTKIQNPDAAIQLVNNS